MVHPNKIEGQCVCGAVRYRVQDDMAAFKLCYCNFCKKASGSAHVANAFTSPDRIEWLEGQEQFTSFDVPNSQVRRVFCRNCGTTLPFETRNGKFQAVPLAACHARRPNPVKRLSAGRPAPHGMMRRWV
ncbi:hypothetical protein NBRC116589_18000 [Ruegeria sp. HU-ET01832]|uniref:GFA family protein n=1 Tax=Ruegeria sp. HU-ET01832 TaxID=3135906 RepID=UPI003107839A